MITLDMSLNATETLVTFAVPPASDIRRTAMPCGPTRRTSRSSGFGWVKLTRVTVTLVISPESWPTLMMDG
jgi:hypothetical protein